MSTDKRKRVLPASTEPKLPATRTDERAYVRESAFDLFIGQSVVITTVTMIYTGVLARVYEQELLLEDAAWIADAGRWAAAVASGDFSEVEPFPDGFAIVGRGGIISSALIPKHPRTTK